MSPLNVALNGGDEKLLELLANKSVASLEQIKKQLEKESRPAASRHSIYSSASRLSLSSPTSDSSCIPTPSSTLSASSAPSPSPSSSPLRSRRAERKSENRQRKLFETTNKESSSNNAAQNETALVGKKSKSQQQPVNDSPFHSHFPRCSLMSEMMKVSHFQVI